MIDSKIHYLFITSKKDFAKYTVFYYPPGGHVKKNESELETLSREFKEKLNLNITDAYKITTSKGDVKKQLTHWYLCDVDSLYFKINKQELKDANYFSISQIKEMKIWHATMKIFNDYIF